MDPSALMAMAHLDKLHANWTTFVFLFFLVVLFIYFGLSLGRIVSTIFSVYIALAIVNSIDYFDPSGPIFGFGGEFAVKLASFIVIIVIALFLVSKIAVKSVVDMHKRGRFFERIVFSVLASGMLTTAIASFLPESVADKFSPLTSALFTSNLAMFLWLILPIFAMLWVKDDLYDPDEKK